MDKARLRFLYDEVQDLLNTAPAENDCSYEENDIYGELANLQDALVNADIDNVPAQHYYEHVYYNGVAQEDVVTRVIAHDEGEALTAVFVAENGRLPKNYGELYAMDGGVHKVTPSDFDHLGYLVSQSIRTVAELDEYDKAILKDLEKAGMLGTNVVEVTAKEDREHPKFISVLSEQAIERLEEMADDDEYYPDEAVD